MLTNVVFSKHFCQSDLSWVPGASARVTATHGTYGADQTVTISCTVARDEEFVRVLRDDKFGDSQSLGPVPKV